MKKSFCESLKSVLFLSGLFTACTIFVMPVCASTPEKETQARSYVDADFTLPYRIFVPPDLPKDKKVPLVLFLHGAGERGEDNTKPLIHGIANFLDYQKKNNRPAILLIPQCPSNMRWVEVHWGDQAHTMPEEPSIPMRAVLKLLEQTMKELPVDAQRVYVTGISMGGFGTWDMIQRVPGLFAAAIPVCGGGDPAHAAKLKELPIWAFHGAVDAVVKPERSRDMIHAIQQAGGNPIYTEYPGVAHVSWTQTYNNRAVLDWLFTQHRQ